MRSGVEKINRKLNGIEVAEDMQGTESIFVAKLGTQGYQLISALPVLLGLREEKNMHNITSFSS